MHPIHTTLNDGIPSFPFRLKQSNFVDITNHSSGNSPTYAPTKFWFSMKFPHHSPNKIALNPPVTLCVVFQKLIIKHYESKHKHRMGASTPREIKQRFLCPSWPLPSRFLLLKSQVPNPYYLNPTPLPLPFHLKQSFPPTHKITLSYSLRFSHSHIT